MKVNLIYKIYSVDSAETIEKKMCFELQLLYLVILILIFSNINSTAKLLR